MDLGGSKDDETNLDPEQRSHGLTFIFPKLYSEIKVRKKLNLKHKNTDDK
ncbi:hypothetical protein IQ259_11730 [Fortiea sp. LEGE XX443]|nr:hypothetical protein [Fortiea sp. LEGE XX443]MBE9005696.1 hypothetical protein [Fortiea sp. LEGE XX443]